VKTRKHEKQGKMRISSGNEDRLGGLGRLVVTLVVLAAILMVTGFFAVRTEGGSQFVQEWIGKRVGIDITAERTRIGWPYVLVLEDVEARPAEEGQPPLLTVREVRLGLRLGGQWSIRIVRGDARLVQDDDGTWSPGLLGRLGVLDPLDITQVSRATAGFRRRARLDIRDSALVWVDARGKVQAAARGIDFRMVPVRVPARRLYHYALSAQSVTREGMRPREVNEEWLAGEGLAPMRILVEKAADQPIQVLIPRPELRDGRERGKKKKP